MWYVFLQEEEVVDGGDNCEGCVLGIVFSGKVFSKPVRAVVELTLEGG